MHLQNLIITQMKHKAENPFVLSGQKQISYAQIYQNTITLCTVFQSLGVRKGERVVFHLPTAVESMVTFYATQLLGAVFVPLNTNWPQKMSQNVIEKLRPVLYIGDNPVEGLCHTLSYKQLSQILNEQEKLPLREFPALAKEDISTILFSSGTTGEPKGIMLSHESLYKKAELFTKSYGWMETDVLLSLGEIHSIDRLRNGCIAPLFIGNRIIVDTKKKKFFSHIADLIAEYGCTITNLTPTLIKQFNLYHDEIDTTKLDSLRLVTSAGNILSLKERETFNALYNKRLLTYYGLTEAAGFCAAVLPNDPISLDCHTGKPVVCEMKVVDETGIAVTAGTKGELLIKSPIPFMAGYFDNPELTRKTICEDWLHTGDLASLDADGVLDVYGRMKDVFKNAYEELIYPSEIEAVIGRHEAVLECCIFNYQAGFGETRIAAVVSLQRDIEQQQLFIELKQLAAAELGTHKTPAYYAIVDDFPKTNHAKIKRHEVKAIFFGEQP